MEPGESGRIAERSVYKGENLGDRNKRGGDWPVEIIGVEQSQRSPYSFGALRNSGQRAGHTP